MKVPLFLLLVFLFLSKTHAQCKCRSKAQCMINFNTVSSAARTKCSIPGGGEGFCCDDNPPSRPTIQMTPFQPPRSQRAPSVDSNSVRNSLGRDRSIRPRSSAVNTETLGHNQFTKLPEANRDVADAGSSLYHLMGDLSLRQSDRLDAENSVEVDGLCPWTGARRPICDDDTLRFRTVDGSCNNLDFPLFGLSGTPFQRILPATYPLGENTPRETVGGELLPSARFVSQTVFDKDQGEERDNKGISTQFMQFSQFVDHDLTHTPVDGTPQCCLPDFRNRDWIYPSDPFNEQPDVCFPIEILSSDVFWGPRGRFCMQVARSATSPTISPLCEAGRFEQQNTLTHWLDGSQIYGSTEIESSDVRSTRDRALLATSGGSRGLLPTCEAAEELGEITEREEPPESCGEDGSCPGCFFVGGDFRVNEQPGLTVQHNVWIREHNRVAEELQSINPRWDQERVFQETRRIVIAEWQHIVFNEWLPIIIGVAYMRVFNLMPLTSGYSLDYDPNFDPRINSEFATAAFRFAHSMITPNIPGKDARGRNVTKLDLKNVFNEGEFLTERGFIEDTVRGQTQDIAPAFDGTFVDDIINHLFEEDEGADGGLDLTALNIQRGREHGIPGYNKYRKECASASSNFDGAGDFSELTDGDWISPSDVRRLREAYNDVDDIDLFIGGIIEKPHRDGLVGPTFKCIIGDQFTRLKRGDRFFYDRGEDPLTRFTLPQLDEIRKASLARINCDNTDITQAQPLMFRVPSPGNELVSCTDGSIPRLNLDVFKDL